MSGAARVRAIDAVEAVAVALRRFQEEVSVALDELQLQIYRAAQWIDADLPHQWKAAERRAWDDLAAARVQLEQARTMKRIAEHDPACREEKQAVEKSLRRVQRIQATLDGLRRWRHTVEKAINEYRSRSQHLRGWLDADLPRGLAALARMTAALDAYLTVPGLDPRATVLSAGTAPDEPTEPPVAPAKAPSNGPDAAAPPTDEEAAP
jgi:hypothetical protein